MTENSRDVEFTCAIKVPDERVSLFNKLREQTEKEIKENGYTWSASGLLANEKLNRYRDVSAYDHSRIILHRGESDYINANLVTVKQAERQYILTQGPLKNTVGHFWLMVWEQNSRAVLMLNNIIENSQVKCHKYWPDANERILNLPDVHLSVEFTYSEDFSNFSKRTFRIIDHKTGFTREIIQFHYTTWPDFSTPKLKDFLTFLWEVRSSGALDKNVGPAIVHCSAGIGRSGTFCLVDSSLVIIEKEGDQNISIVNLLIEMRRSRMGLIQTPNQLIFSFEAIIEGVKNIRDPNFNGYEPENVPPPLPPPRFASLAGTTTVHDNYMLNHIDRALPEIPGNGSSNSDDDDDDDIIDEDDDDDDDDDDDSDVAIGNNTNDPYYRYNEEDEENVVDNDDDKVNNGGNADNKEKINHLLETITKDDRIIVENNINANNYMDINDCTNCEGHNHANKDLASNRFSEDGSQNNKDVNQMYSNNFTNGNNDIPSQPPPPMVPIKMNAELNSSDHLLNDQGSRSVNEAVLRRRNVRHVRLATMQAKVKEIKSKQRASERKTAFGSKKSLMILTATVIIIAFCLYKYSNIFNFTNSSSTNGNDDFIFVKHLSDDYHDGRDNDASVKNLPTVNDMKRKHIIGEHTPPKRRSDNDEVLQKRDDEAAADDSLETNQMKSSVNDKKRKHKDSEDQIKSSWDNHSSIIFIAATAVVCVICAYAYTKFTTSTPH